MTRIERIKEIPKLAWVENSAWEFSRVTPEALMLASASAYKISSEEIPLAALGLIYVNLCSPPVMWLFLTKACLRKPHAGVKALKEAIEYLPKGTLTTVARDFDAGRRFAEFFGFRNIGIAPAVDGRAYDIYRRD